MTFTSEAYCRIPFRGYVLYSSIINIYTVIHVHVDEKNVYIKKFTTNVNQATHCHWVFRHKPTLKV